MIYYTIKSPKSNSYERKNMMGNEFSLSVDYEKGIISSLILNGVERKNSDSPIFRVGLRNSAGDQIIMDSCNAETVREISDGAEYIWIGPGGQKNLVISVMLSHFDGGAEWRVSAQNGVPDLLIEWIEFPMINLPPLRENNKNGKGGEILFPFNEGALVSDLSCREEGSFRHMEPEYPSKGSYAIFPNMICSQMIAYLWDDCGLYFGAHDSARGVKAIDFYGESGGVTLQMRLYSGVSYGEDFMPDYPMIWAVTDGNWMSAAEIYRKWFETNLPAEAIKVSENDTLPEWYEDSPLVVSYPVRGRFDTDEMSPNALYPYTNALPMIDEIKSVTDSRILVLLMHWEGTAPWAPPYVWPPYGDYNNFNEFMKALHSRNDLLGVYCSGFGYTIQSNLVSEYNRSSEYEKEKLDEGMCAGPDGRVSISRICTAQRSGYDICPASEKGRKILLDAYKPLFDSGVDYAQILDQNHGGGQYFCYSRNHGHPEAPGKWMTKNMQEMLSEWNRSAGKMLLGCESAAGEAFIGNLLFSDNRYELNYMIGRPVPLYAYLYHEYLRNFMGNQVSCPFHPDLETLRYRLAYSFSIGDCMTLVVTPEGELAPNWGRPHFTVPQDKEKALRLISNLTKFYKVQGKRYLYNGRMTVLEDFECETVTYGRRNSERSVILPSVLASAWCDDGERIAYILVNPEDREAQCTLRGKRLHVPPLNAILVRM